VRVPLFYHPHSRFRLWWCAARGCQTVKLAFDVNASQRFRNLRKHRAISREEKNRRFVSCPSPPGIPIICHHHPELTALKPALLIVDDDPLIGESLSFVLSDDFEVRVRESRTEAMDLLKSGEFQPQLALIDLGLPPVPHLPTEGFKLLGDLLAWSQSIRVLVLSGQNEDSNARRARAGCHRAGSKTMRPCTFA
jgi:CheY-like chemotaxis protein